MFQKYYILHKFCSKLKSIKESWKQIITWFPLKKKKNQAAQLFSTVIIIRNVFLSTRSE